jgi:hypothetical protein
VSVRGKPLDGQERHSEVVQAGQHADQRRLIRQLARELSHRLITRPHHQYPQSTQSPGPVRIQSSLDSNGIRGWLKQGQVCCLLWHGPLALRVSRFEEIDSPIPDGKGTIVDQQVSERTRDQTLDA